jgi:DNA-binding transcriptional ArsR family regulator
MPPIAILIALADPTRCRILEILRDGPQPVHVLAASFDISRPAISRHLRVLKQARLISEKKTGRENRYELHASQLKPAADWLAEFASARKAVSKKTARPKPVPAAEPVVAVVAVPEARPEPAPEPVPAPVPELVEASKPGAKPKPAAKPKPPGEPAASQMGFDF